MEPEGAHGPPPRPSLVLWDPARRAGLGLTRRLEEGHRSACCPPVSRRDHLTPSGRVSSIPAAPGGGAQVAVEAGGPGLWVAAGSLPGEERRWTGKGGDG